MRKLSLCVVILTTLFFIGCKHVSSIDPNHGMPGDVITVTATEDAFADCTSLVTKVYFVDSVDNNQYTTGKVIHCDDSTRVQVQVPDLSGACPIRS